MPSDLRHTFGPLGLACGSVLPQVTVAYAAYGRLAEDGSNAILVTHGYTASHQMLAHGQGTAEGSWAPLIGPGKPLDTERYYIVCSNMLGSCYGTTGPGSIDPRSGRPYGPDFPEITLADVVEVQRRLLEHLGVQRLRTVVGPSFGGFQALQWALDQPGRVDAIGVIVSAPRLAPNRHLGMDALLATLRADPHWNGGHYYERGGIVPTLEKIRTETMYAYGMDAVLAARGWAPPQRQAHIQAAAAAWAREFDGNALVTLLRAAQAFDARPRLEQVRANVLHVVANSDLLFPPDPTMQAAMARTRGHRPLRYLEMDTPFGHQASGPAHALWSEALRELIEGAGR
ncbi:alpha/beta fold hydrolase [Xylophilus sp. GW821-FHT01B05]